MNRWRFVLVALVILTLMILIGTELIFDRPLSWLPGREFISQRHRVFLERTGIADVGRRILIGSTTLLSSFLIGTLFLYAVPERVRYIATRMNSQPSLIRKYFGVGILGLLGLGSIVLISSFSVFTFPASILLLLMLFTFTTLGTVSLSFQIGRWLLKQAGWEPNTPLVPLGLGTLLIFTAIRIPYFGILFLIVASCTGFGAALSTRFGSGTQWTLHALLEE